MDLGRVYFIGAGPGDPGLLSIKAQRILKKADVIIYDRLINNILLQYSKKDCKLIYVGKNPDRKYMQQNEINDVINVEAAKGKIVARLKGGDPAIFGRLSEEIDSLGADIKFEVIPGITSATAAATYSGFPLTDRQYSPHVTFATGHLKKDSVKTIDFQALAKGGTLALYMGMKELPNIVKVLSEDYSEQLPIAVIGNASYGYQKTVVSDIAHIVEEVEKHQIKHPAMIIIGDVVNCRTGLSWFEQLNDFGRKVLIISHEKVDIEAVAALYDNGGYYYVIDQIDDTDIMEKFKEVHAVELKEHSFDEIWCDDHSSIVSVEEAFDCKFSGEIRPLDEMMQISGR